MNSFIQTLRSYLRDKESIAIVGFALLVVVAMSSFETFTNLPASIRGNSVYAPVESLHSAASVSSAAPIVKRPTLTLIRRILQMHMSKLAPAPAQHSSSSTQSSLRK